MNNILIAFYKERFFYFTFLLAILGVFYFQNQHDYFAYVMEWNRIFEGDQPLNSYGFFLIFFPYPIFYIVNYQSLYLL
jgi:hypothetical protein